MMSTADIMDKKRRPRGRSLHHTHASIRRRLRAILVRAWKALDEYASVEIREDDSQSVASPIDVSRGIVAVFNDLEIILP